MSDPVTPSPPPSFGDRLTLAFVAILRALARTTLILFILATIGLTIFYGIPWLYEKFLLPIEENTARLEILEAEQQALQQQATQSAAEAMGRIGTLEAQATLSARALSALQTQVNQASSTLQANQSNLESTLTASLKRLDALETALPELQSALTGLETSLGDLSNQSQNQAASLAALRNEVQILKAMHLLTRSRLALAQDNLEMARQDIGLARNILAGMLPFASPDQAEYLQEVIGRLDKVLTNLIGAPYVATFDLEAAWQMLLLGLPSEAPPLTATPSPLATPQTSAITPTPAPYPYPNP